MFRLSHYYNIAEGRAGRGGKSHGARCGGKPIVIWNLTRTCNLSCVHCYASSKARGYSRELSTEQAVSVMDGLYAAGVRTVILSGGEPMIRGDILNLAASAKEKGFMTSISTNGTLIGEKEADRIAAAGLDYVGVSLDGIGETHDRVRGVEGSFEQAVAGLFRLAERGVKCGVRFTLTRMNMNDLPAIFEFAEKNGIGKIYLSHLVYSGRGGVNRGEDVTPAETREAMDYVFSKAREYTRRGRGPQIVTGNNDADAAYLLLRLMEGSPEGAERLLPVMERFGGANAGVGVANIDPTGEVHPDPLMSSVNLGNVTEKSFGEIWHDSENPVLKRLRARPRVFNGRCGRCAWLKVCGGSCRVRALRMTGDMWGHDPACYLTDEETQVELAQAV
ncbi:MAG: radical SAM protein [Candidatus Nitrospinota bacterium M3_3B_026]